MVYTLDSIAAKLGMTNGKLMRLADAKQIVLKREGAGKFSFDTEDAINAKFLESRESR
ncbi:hypothetical protein [Botrimarina mediterranea]|uniref:Uncharacterized protein n=1 Tax=Botrimarina mediterranea TaxID=2528022 RepID=A0A518K5J9_9BACT|nr:hypothetical protein [Botrimarina mediterranea]QDV73072.1 hypothetical protein Spa11_12610 [Botrimarina mediterranea]